MNLLLQINGFQSVIISEYCMLSVSASPPEEKTTQSSRQLLRCVYMCV